jgi:hypothetical protein
MREASSPWVSEEGSTSAESAVSRFGQLADSGTHSVVRFAVVPPSGEMRERKHFALPMFNIREKFESVKSRRRECIPCGQSPALAIVRGYSKGDYFQIASFVVLAIGGVFTPVTKVPASAQDAVYVRMSTENDGTLKRTNSR